MIQYIDKSTLKMIVSYVLYNISNLFLYIEISNNQ